MDEKDKSMEVIGNIRNMLGSALLLYPLIESASKKLIPEIQKLQSGETLRELKMLPVGQEERDDSEDREKPEHEEERKPNHNEVSELKRKLAEYEEKEKRQYQ